ncbi:MAG: hypothetical protein QM731_10330 [Chitinophagaceae bacterium]
MKRTTFDPRNIVFLGTYRKMLVFYFWHGRYCVRTVSSLSGKRVKRAAEFKVTMQYARRLGCASKVAAAVYRQLPDGWKLHDLYRKMTGLGASLLRERVYTTEELEMALWQYLASVGFKAEEHCVQHTVPVELKLPCVLPAKVPHPPKSLSRLRNPTGIAREKNNTAGRKKAIALRTHYLHSDTNDERNATQRSSIVLPPLVALYSTTLKKNCNSS